MKSDELDRDTLSSKYPSIAKQWHPTLNGDVTPYDVKPNTKVKYYWLLTYDDEKTGKHFEFVWKASPNERVNGNGCPYLVGKAIWIGYNDLETTHPLLALEWHPWRNGDLKPTDVTRGKRLKVWWYLPYDDPVLGHFDFEWEAWIADRAKGAGCPFLTGNKVWPGFNDLATRAPWMAMQWHPTKNGNLKPKDITCNHHKKVWWLLPYDDPDLGHFDFEWEASPNTRMTEPGCPFLEGNGVWLGYNDLLSRYPLVASQFHPQKNGKVSPKEISFASNKTYWWYLPYDDPVLGHFDFEWEAKVNNRTLLGEGCPYPGNDKVWVGYNDLQTRFPEISVQWHPTKNGKLTPEDVVFGTPKIVWWMQPYVDPDTGQYFEFEWKAPVNIRTGVGTNNGHQTGCPYLAPNPKVWKGFNDLESCCAAICKEWHPTRNRKLTPDKLYKEATRKVWWKCSKCRYEWFGSVKGRTVDGVGCKKCRKNREFDL